MNLHRLDFVSLSLSALWHPARRWASLDSGDPRHPGTLQRADRIRAYEAQQRTIGPWPFI